LDCRSLYAALHCLVMQAEQPSDGEARWIIPIGQQHTRTIHTRRGPCL
jgi:hypothetical protein